MRTQFRFAAALTLAACCLFSESSAFAALITLNPQSDYYIDPNGTLATGNDTVFNNGELRAGKFVSGNTAGAADDLRAFLKFDLSAIPAGSTINSAALRLFHADAPNNDQFGGAAVHVITGSGVDATFGTHDDTFGAGLGNLVNPPHEGENLYHQISVTGTVQNWLDMFVANNGFMIRGAEDFGNTGKLFNSSEAGSNLPELVIDFTVPEPQSLAVWSILSLSLAGCAYFRLRRKKL